MNMKLPFLFSLQGKQKNTRGSLDSVALASVNNRVAGTILAIAALLTCQSAGATVISIADNLADNAYWQAGSHNGKFDITPSLTPASDYHTPYHINSAMAYFYFYDNYDSVTTNRSTTTTFASDGSFSYTQYSTTSDPAESVTLNISDDTAFGHTAYFDTGFVYSGYAYWTECGWGCWTNSATYMNRNLGYKGSFTIGQNLSATALNDLSSDGILDFSGIVNGDLMLGSAWLSVDIDSNPPAPPLVSSVPEPETLSITLLGLGLIGCITRQRG